MNVDDRIRKGFEDRLEAIHAQVRGARPSPAGHGTGRPRLRALLGAAAVVGVLGAASVWILRDRDGEPQEVGTADGSQLAEPLFTLSTANAVITPTTVGDVAEEGQPELQQRAITWRVGYSRAVGLVEPSGTAELTEVVADGQESRLAEAQASSDFFTNAFVLVYGDEQGRLVDVVRWHSDTSTVDPPPSATDGSQPANWTLDLVGERDAVDQVFTTVIRRASPAGPQPLDELIHAVLLELSAYYADGSVGALLAPSLELFDASPEATPTPTTGLTLTPVAEQPDADCIPSPAIPTGEIPSPENDRRHEDIIEYLTGERQTSDEDPVEATIDNPNYGGVWGDRQGGVVVAVLDCSLVDADELARLAGGPQLLHLIQVPYTFRQVDQFRDTLVAELQAAGIQADVLIDPTPTGRRITVNVRDVGDLPSDFGAAVPDDIFEVVETEDLSETN